MAPERSWRWIGRADAQRCRGCLSRSISPDGVLKRIWPSTVAAGRAGPESPETWRFCRSGLADQAEDFAFVQVEVDAADASEARSGCGGCGCEQAAIE